MSEGTEADPLCDSGPLRGQLQEAIEKRIGPGRHFALNSSACEDPVPRLGVASFSLPGQQLGSGQLIDGNRPAGGLRFALPYNAVHDRPGNVHLLWDSRGGLL